MEIDAVKFGKTLRKIRNEKQMTAAELASKIGYTQPYISMLENGRKGIPKPDTLRKIAKGLDIPYIELMNKAGYIPAETDSLFESFGLTSREIEKVNKSGIVSKGKEIYVDKVYLDKILRDDKITVYYEEEIVTKDEKKKVDQLIKNHLKRG